MSQPSAHSDQDMVRRMLDAARKSTPPRSADQEAEPVPYNWESPHRYLQNELARLDEVAAAFAKAVSQAVSALVRTEVRFDPAGMTQCYAGRVNRSADQGELYLTELLGAGGRPCGLIAMPTAAAAGWVARLLGAAPGNPNREPSDLETDLLVDLLWAIAQGASSVSQSRGGPALSHGKGVTRGRMALPADDSAEYCRFLLRSPGPQGDSEVFFLLAVGTVDNILGMDHRDPQADTSPEQTRQLVLGYVRRTSLRAAVRLGQAQVTLREVMALEAGDVVRLDRRIDQPVEVVVGDRPLLLANTVTCAGRYAAQIVSWIDSPEESNS